MLNRLLIKEIKNISIEEICREYPYIFKPAKDENIIIFSSVPKDVLVTLEQIKGKCFCYCHAVIVELIDNRAHLAKVACSAITTAKELTYNELIYYFIM